MHSFPKAAVTKYYRLGGLKHQTLLSCVLEVKFKVKCPQAALPPRALEEDSHWLRPAPGGCWPPWLMST